MSATPTPTQPPRLIISAVLFVIALAVAIVFSTVFSEAPALDLNKVASGVPVNPHDHGHGHHHGHGEHKGHNGHNGHDNNAAPKPAYTAGGFWSDDLQLAELSRLAVLMAAGDRPAICLSLSWHNEKLVVTDQSPLLPSASDKKPMVYLSPDYSGGRAPQAFLEAVSAFVKKFNGAHGFYTIPPIKGPVPWPNDEEDDWSFLLEGDNDDFLFWSDIEMQKDLAGLPYSGHLLAWLKSIEADYAELSGASNADLIKALSDPGNPVQAAKSLWNLRERDPYELMPVLGAWLIAAKPEQRNYRLAVTLMLRRIMGVRSDALIAEAAASKDPVLRRQAARAIGVLHGVTNDPFGMLTKLAEDRVMDVRREALLACRSIDGPIAARYAAGVAELVETYDMDPAMKTLYAQTMAQLLTYGEPFVADSRVNELRRMSLNKLMAEERDALVCRVLLERQDLPDAMIPQLIGQIAGERKKQPVEALIEFLPSLSASTLAKRPPLLKTLANWPANELKPHTKKLVELVKSDQPAVLRAASAGALANALPPNDVTQLLGSTPIVYQGLFWLSRSDAIKPWSANVIKSALSADAEDPAVTVAALDALKLLPADALNSETIAGVLKTARTASQVGLRFAGIRAINSLPDSLKPDKIDDLKLTTLELRTVPGANAYDLAELKVTAGRPVELTLINPDNMQHNLVITKPRQGQAIGVKAASLTSAEQYVPESDDVLFYMPLVDAGQTYTLRFIAPSTPGNYDYVCTFPGHPATMNGVLVVVAP